MVPRSTHRQDTNSSIYNPVPDSAEHLPVPVTVGEFSLVETASSLWVIGSCLSNNSDGEIGCGDGCSAKMMLTCRSMSTSLNDLSAKSPTRKSNEWIGQTYIHAVDKKAQ